MSNVSLPLVTYRCILLPVVAIIPLGYAKMNSVTTKTANKITRDSTRNKKILSPSSRDTVIKKSVATRKKQKKKAKRKKKSTTMNGKNDFKSLFLKSLTSQFVSLSQILTGKWTIATKPKEFTLRKSFKQATTSTTTRVTGYGSIHHKSIETLQPSMLHGAIERGCYDEPAFVYIGLTTRNDGGKSATPGLMFYSPILNSTVEITALHKPAEQPSWKLNQNLSKYLSSYHQKRQKPYLSIVQSSPIVPMPMYPVEGFFGLYYLPSGMITVWIVQSDVIYNAPTIQIEMQKQNHVDCSKNETTLPTSWYTIRKVAHLHLVHIPYTKINANTSNDIPGNAIQSWNYTNSSTPVGTGELYLPYRTAEERRQVRLLRQALKAHDWYYCTNGNNDNDISSFRIPDMTRNIQQSMILLEQRAANALQLVSLVNETNTNALVSSNNYRVSISSLKNNQSSMVSFVKDCNRYIHDTLRTINSNKDTTTNSHSDTCSVSNKAKLDHNITVPWWDVIDSTRSRETTDCYENEDDGSINPQLKIKNATTSSRTNIAQERVRLLSIQQRLGRPDSRFFWNEELIEPLVQNLKDATEYNNNNRTCTNGNNQNKNDIAFSDRYNNHAFAIRTLLQHCIPVTSAFVGAQYNLSTVEKTTSGTNGSNSTKATTNKKHQSKCYFYDQVLISRRSRFRAGTRFTKRGADSTGNVANYAETEQLVFVWNSDTNESQCLPLHPTNKRNFTTVKRSKAIRNHSQTKLNRTPTSKRIIDDSMFNNCTLAGKVEDDNDSRRSLLAVCSYVQTRGSIPLRWSSPTDIKTYRPRVRIGIDPIAQAKALQLHLIDQIQRYCLPFTGTTVKSKNRNRMAMSSPVVAVTTNKKNKHHPSLLLVNLVDKKSDQGRLGRAFDAVLRAVLEVYEQQQQQQQQQITEALAAKDDNGHLSTTTTTTTSKTSTEWNSIATATTTTATTTTAAAAVIPDPVTKYMTRSNIQHVWFDFHAEVKSGRWDRLITLLERVKPTIRGHGYFMAAPALRRTREREDIMINNSDKNNLIPFQFHKLQRGIIRTNCMDCLDRTNVVQSLFGRSVLFQQLADLRLHGDGGGIDDDDEYNGIRVIPHSYIVSFRQQPMVLPSSLGEYAHRLLWADNADSISRLYAGTPALKGDFTRTGRRTKKGAIDDGMNSLQRYYVNNFVDADRQEGIDLLIGYERFRNTIMMEEQEHFQQQQVQKQQQVDDWTETSQSATDADEFIKRIDGEEHEYDTNNNGEDVTVHEAARYALLELAKSKNVKARTTSSNNNHRLFHDETTPTTYARIKQSKSSLSSSSATTRLLDLWWLPGDLQNQFRTTTFSSRIHRRRNKNNNIAESMSNSFPNNNTTSSHHVDDDDSNDDNSADFLFVPDAIEAIDRRTKSNSPWWVISNDPNSNSDDDDHDHGTSSSASNNNETKEEYIDSDKGSDDNNNNQSITPTRNDSINVATIVSNESTEILQAVDSRSSSSTAANNITNSIVGVVMNENTNAAYIVGVIIAAAGIHSPVIVAIAVLSLIAIFHYYSTDILATTVLITCLTNVLRFLNS